MPPPIPVQLLPHDFRWASQAEAELRVLASQLGPCLVAAHHVGSTAIPGIPAKPILDLLPVFASMEDMDGHRSDLELIGYKWWGELGLPGRRYCTKDDAVTGERLVQLHCYVAGSPEIVRHLAFRDYLRDDARAARAYGDEKARCQGLHPLDSHAYGACKSDLIGRLEKEALQWWNGCRQP